MNHDLVGLLEDHAETKSPALKALAELIKRQKQEATQIQNRLTQAMQTVEACKARLQYLAGSQESAVAAAEWMLEHEEAFIEPKSDDKSKPAKS